MKTYVNETKLAREYPQGQELIWDSGAGFDVVTYEGTTNLLNGKMAACKMKTGKFKGRVIPIEKQQLEQFSLKKWAEMRNKYPTAS